MRFNHSASIVSNLHERAVELRRVLTFLLLDHDLDPGFLHSGLVETVSLNSSLRKLQIFKSGF